MSIAEQEHLLEDICNDVLGYGPLEPLLARDDIADIMVNGADRVFIEVAGKIQLTNIRFRDNAQLMNICQRIVSQVGRRVDESSPICDARLPDGSRVNVIAPPLAHRRPDAHHPEVQERQAEDDEPGRVRLDLRKARASWASSAPAAATSLISGGTGSGKTTLLNTLTAFIDPTERVITCEDAAELQLQQPHVVRLETRPPNLEGHGHDHDARPGQELPAYASRADHRRRGPRTRSVRPAAGHEHRPRRLDGHAARQHARAKPSAVSNR